MQFHGDTSDRGAVYVSRNDKPTLVASSRVPQTLGRGLPTIRALMRRRLKQWWPVLKALFTLAILVAIGRQFYRDLQHPDLWRRSLDLSWLLLAGLVYLLGLGFSCLFWYRLLRTLGQRPD